MDLRHLRYFVAMAEAGSLMKASERLHVAQPALSVHLANLETEIGVQLVSRTNRGIELTDDGKLLYERATILLQYYQDSLIALKRRKKMPRGLVSVGMPASCPVVFAAELYRVMRAELPEVQLYIAEASTAMLYEWLYADRIDFAMLFSLPTNTGLEMSPLFVEEFCFVSKPDPAVTATEINFEDIFDHKLVVPCRSTTWRKILDDAAQKHGRMLETQFESESVAVMRAIAMAGEAHAILPRSCLHEDVANGVLHARRITNPDMRGLLSLASVASKELGPAQLAVKEIVLRTAGIVTDRWNAASQPGKVTPIIRVLPSSVLPAQGRRVSSR